PVPLHSLLRQPWTFGELLIGSRHGSICDRIKKELSLYLWAFALLHEKRDYCSHVAAHAVACDSEAACVSAELARIFGHILEDGIAFLGRNRIVAFGRAV